jgi:integrase
MPAPAHKIVLTDRFLKTLKPDPDGKRLVIWDAVLPGLAVRVTAKGKRGFYMVKRRLGDTMPSWVLLGHYPPMSLAEARKQAGDVLGALIEGRHPKRLAEERRRGAEEKRRQAEATTFRAIAERFERTYLPRKAPSSARVYRGHLSRTWVPAFGAMQVSEIKRRSIIEQIEGVAEVSGPSAAIGALSTIRLCLNWALASDLIESNPASGIKTDIIVGKPESRDRLLADAEVVAIWRAIPAVGAPWSTIYKLLLLLGLRLNEVAAARWEHLDLDAATLLVPSESAKSSAAQLVPLPPLAVELFAAMPRFSGPFIFSTSGGRVPVQHPSAAKARLDAALAAQGAEIPAFVAHDFRRAVRSGLGRLGVPAVVAELVLGHKQPGIVGVYDRHSYFAEKRAALERWQKHLLGLVSPAPEGGNIVTLPARVSA